MGQQVGFPHGMPLLRRRVRDTLALSISRLQVSLVVEMREIPCLMLSGDVSGYRGGGDCGGGDCDVTAAVVIVVDCLLLLLLLSFVNFPSLIAVLSELTGTEEEPS